MQDTIAAIATGTAMSAIGIIRISGGGAIAAVDKIFSAAGGVRMEHAENRRMYYGELSGPDGKLLDLCMCTVSRGPNSYTGEDTAELQCHGSPTVMAGALRALFAQGVRQAEAGEFTKRAFLNGRMDLTQAEAVIDLIEAETSAAAQNAAGQLRGAVGQKLGAVHDSLLDVMAHFHAAIDYPDEDIDDFELNKFLPALSDAERELSLLLSTYDRGRVLRDGVPTAIIGRPNTGKSSLLNALLGYDRAIVTDIAGTTRDTIEEKIIIGGVPLRVIDTAGIRKTDDAVERLGVERTLSAVREASLAILVLDGSEPLRREDFEALQSIPVGVPGIAAVNKTDLPPAVGGEELRTLGLACCRISAVTGKGISELEAEIKKLFPDFSSPSGGGLITNARQAGAILRARDCVREAAAAFTSSLTPDAALTEIEAALTAIGEVTGKTMREDITARIFERFCVGK